MGLLEDSELRESLTKMPPEDMRQLMRCIEEYKRLEDDRLQSKGKAMLLNRSQQSVFPSSLGPTTLRWFNGLRKGSIHSFAELIQEFGARFITCSWAPQPVDALLSMKMRIGKTLHNYASWYWELYNEIGGGKRRSQPAPLEWGFSRIQNCENR